MIELVTRLDRRQGVMAAFQTFGEFRENFASVMSLLSESDNDSDDDSDLGGGGGGHLMTPGTSYEEPSFLGRNYRRSHGRSGQ